MKLRYIFVRRDISQEEKFLAHDTKQESLKKKHNRSLNGTIQYLLKRRRENIIRSMVRPLYQEVLKSLFLIFVLLTDTLIPLEIFLDFSFPLNIILALVVLIIFLYIEIRVYNTFWGKNGRWSLEKYKKQMEKND